MPSHVKYTEKKQCYLPSIFKQHLSNSNIVVPSYPTLYELAKGKK